KTPAPASLPLYFPYFSYRVCLVLFLRAPLDFPQRGKSRSATRLRSAGMFLAGNLARSACVRPAPDQSNPSAIYQLASKISFYYLTFVN
ncbi:MAG: hypothetical protein PHV98_00885, partial [Candidatus Omnitrophica bacterium]|nr:hypothetical protein [Candidatus Omnitrophota bacterium]